MTRYQFAERVLRAVYGDMPNDDSNITYNLVNQWMLDATGIAAQKNYKDNGVIEGVQFVNNSFYTTFRSIPIATYEQFIFRATLPQIPFGLGYSEGVGTIQFVDANGNVSDAAIPLSQNQVGMYQNIRPLPNKTLYYSEGPYVYMISDLDLSQYTIKTRMVSGGDSTDKNSTLNVPDDYFPIMMDYCIKMLRQERAQPRDIANDGEDQP